MKKKLIVSLLVMITIAGGVMAQQNVSAVQRDQQITHDPPNETTNDVILYLLEELGLSKEQMANAYDPFFEFFNAHKMAMKNLSTDREKLDATKKVLREKRNEQLAMIFTQKQMKKFIQETEALMWKKIRASEEK